jgi:hypothetical protein
MGRQYKLLALLAKGTTALACLALLSQFEVGVREALAAEAAAAAPAKPLGLGDPGQLTGIVIDAGRAPEGGLKLRGSEGRQQLVVTGKYSTGQMRDLTRDVVYTVTPENVLHLTSTGLATTRGNGIATITAEASGGLKAQLQIAVESFERNDPINFPNQIVPIFTKLTCNSGGCHGKSSGQNGFKLSLLGFEPAEDYEHLVNEARGRRLFPASPDQSLLLLKATGSLPHGGGSRLELGSPQYNLIRRWIAEGTLYGDPEAAVVESIEVFPKERLMPPNGLQQLVVIAKYTDGTSQEVTSTAQFEANVAEMAEISRSGLVTTMDQTGDVAVMVRYQSQVGVFRATIPLGAPVEKVPATKNFIDELVFKKLKLLGLPPSEISDDATFLRRVTVDIAGRLPTLEETQAFLADTDAAKRDKWIDKLLASTDYADYFANKWASILRNKRRSDDYKRGTFAFHEWIRQNLYQNRPYDEFVRDVLAASGELGRNPAVMWYREVKDVNSQVEDTAQLFLGLRIQCAKCHHHPFEKWSQNDYYSFSAFFSQVGRKPGEIASEERIFHKSGLASATNPKNNLKVVPTGLGSEPMEIAAEDDPRQALVDWMSNENNPFFAPTIVNRYRKHFIGRGLVDPEDDMRATKPATNPDLLAALAQHFIKSGFDMKDLIRTICRSNTYQLSSEPNDYNIDDKQNFSRYYPKRLTAEVLLDSVDRVTGSPTKFAGVPQGTRAVQLPDSSFNSYFLTVFGRPDSASACECERANEANLAQGLHLINSSEVHGKLSNGAGRAAELSKDEAEIHDKIREIYLIALSRQPTDEEMGAVYAYLQKKSEAEQPNMQQAYEDILWTMLNTKEFLFNH